MVDSPSDPKLRIVLYAIQALGWMVLLVPMPFGGGGSDRRPPARDGQLP
jgi:hypothetical protein